MLRVLTPGEMQKADRSEIESGTPSFDLMMSAGHAVAAATRDLLGGTYGRHVTAICGKGNNGGDGLVAAALLAGRGASVNALLTADPALLEGDAAMALKFFEDRCGRARLGSLTPGALERDRERSDVIIDALAGTGFRGALRGPASEAAETLNRSGARVLSVDIPSGVDGESGQVEGAAVRAVKTVTLAALKPGLLLQPGAGYAGEVEIADIGIREDHLEAGMHLAEGRDVASLLPARAPDAHKRSVGKVLIVAGSPGMSGAAVLAAKAALRTGAGLVWVAAPGSASAIIEQNITEAVVETLPATASGTIAVSALERVKELAQQADSVAVGPGMGRDEETTELLLEIFGTVHQPLIVDADGINAFTGMAGRMLSRSSPAVLTPHAGELARLIGEDVKQIGSRPVESALKASAMTGATVLLKGNPTLVAGNDRVVVVNTGGPFLATAGTGDVLTGVIAALAAGVRPFESAWAGAWLHGFAGRLAARAIAEPPRGQTAGRPGSDRAAVSKTAGMADRGLVASDVARMLPRAILEAGAGS